MNKKFLMCHNISNQCLCGIKQYWSSFFASYNKISHPSITHASFSPFSLSFFLFLSLALSLMVASFIFFPLLFTSSETLVKDNIYRKPPIYKQHGTVYFLLTLPPVVSARCVACCVAFICLSLYSPNSSSRIHLYA